MCARPRPTLACHPSGPSSIVWCKSQKNFPYIQGVVPIIISWFTSPILSAICASILFLFTRHASEQRAGLLTCTLCVRLVAHPRRAPPFHSWPRSPPW